MYTVKLIDLFNNAFLSGILKLQLKYVPMKNDINLFYYSEGSV